MDLPPPPPEFLCIVLPSLFKSHYFVFLKGFEGWFTSLVGAESHQFPRLVLVVLDQKAFT